MSLLQMNMYRDSWAYRSTTGFPKPKQFDEQIRTLGNNSPSPTRSQQKNNQHAAQMEDINRTLSAIQFSRPSSAGAWRPSKTQTSTSSKSIRPQTASGLTFSSSHQSQNPPLDMTYEPGNYPTHTQSTPFLPPNQSSATLKSFTTQGTKLPHYVATDKQVLRFYCHFYDSNTQITYQPIRNFNSAPTIRYVTLHYFLEDETFEMFSQKVPNSGIQGGLFYRRDVLKKSTPGGNGGVLEEYLKITDLSVGGTFSALGRDFFITDCDEFTREYFRREYGIQLANPLPRPSLPDANNGAAISTGLQNMKHLSTATTNKEQKNKTGYGTRSLEYFNKKTEIQKTQQFLKCPSGACLKFDCIEWTPSSSSSSSASNRPSPGGNVVLSGGEKHYDLIYSLSDHMVEVRTKKVSRLSADEPSLLLKKTKLPKNWRIASIPGRENPDEWYTFHDFNIGMTIDVYGKILLLVSCDPFTKNYYQKHLHLQLKPIKLHYPPDKTYPVEVPVLGDGYLPIGSEEDTLHTVLGHPKPSKNWKKIQRNLGQIIRCRCRMITENLIDMTRVFHLTFYLEDDTLAIYEESIRNSGVMGGYYLKRGSYINELPPEIANSFTNRNDIKGDIVPREFYPTDIYLGNILGVNGSIYQVVEMDDMSIRFCEENSDEYPYFDTLAIIQHVIGKVLEKKIDLREYIERYHDTNHRYWIDDREFVTCLEEIDIIGEMNDQEVMTVMRRFKEVLEGNMIQRKIERQKEGGGSGGGAGAGAAGGGGGGGGTARGSARSSARGGGNSSGEGKYFYHEFCDLFSYASYIENGKAPRERGLRAKSSGGAGAGAAAGGRNGRGNVEKLDRLLDEMRGRLTQWRRAIRMDNHIAENRYITGAYLASVFAKNGLKLSISDLRLLVDNYSVPNDVLERDPSLVERLNRVLPSDELETTLNEEGGYSRSQLVEKQLKLKYSQLQQTLRRQEEKEGNNLTLPHHHPNTATSSTPSAGAASRKKHSHGKLTIQRDEEKELENNEKERKSAMFTRSILRTKSMEPSGVGGGGQTHDEEGELSKAVINYHNLCNDIYICDWGRY